MEDRVIFQCFLVDCNSDNESYTDSIQFPLQTIHVNSTLKRRGNGRFYVFSTWNPRGVFVGLLSLTNMNINNHSKFSVQFYFR